ncbi:helix-turn-helix domain-containing protein [Megasphaera vaginalis (ex Srinivasan et al. 2021)]|uniref:DNA-binding helix-turn-helix protein n=1 Tax=Megasphaera vaginalis (ex Srinivasan et al. 2021) TaxID=1111454 RepID=U7UU86_9FIRM|nr:helix-turn-helix transcriptional regulator [Megasphaera vaginalis (ex Srinivasan et al. 2021)]ERT62464.1 DNA-binding helix-turn-helix protein [Megasphaera vaginalis (ex Srinivasan et al. 2021)]
MDYSIYFSKRLKLLRTTYGLSMKTLSTTWGYKNTGTISQFENNKSVPSFNSLIQIANFYAVSLDWLIGRSNIIYTKESVFEGEIALHEQFMNLGEQIGFNYIAALQKGWEFMAPTYLYKDKREKYYSLDVRANIVVLHNLVTLENLYWSWYYLEGMYRKKGLLDRLQKLAKLFKSDDKIVEYLSAKEKEKTEILSSLICLDTQIIDGKEAKIKRTVPVYDVAAAYRKLQQETDDTNE